MYVNKPVLFFNSPFPKLTNGRGPFLLIARIRLLGGFAMSHMGLSGRYMEPPPLQAPWWRHQMETFSALLAICAGNSPVTGEFPAQRPVTRSFYAFFELRMNKRLSKHWWGWWFETPSRPLRRRCNTKRTTNGTHIMNTYNWRSQYRQKELPSLQRCSYAGNLWNLTELLLKYITEYPLRIRQH